MTNMEYYFAIKICAVNKFSAIKAINNILSFKRKVSTL